MAAPTFFIKLLLFLVLICCFSTAFAQDEKNPPNADKKTEDTDNSVLKVNTELIQTGVAVFDKKGNFIDNLKQDDFELLVDGKPVAIQFFEPNIVKNTRPATKSEKGETKSAVSNVALPNQPGGRTILFVVDDLHLSADSHYRVRKLIFKFIESEMLPEDVIAVVSTTGKIGFLQQFTSDKTVLRAAAERLIYNKDRRATDRSNPPMTEFEAQLIDRYDQQVTDVFAGLIMQEMPGTTLESARQIARSRARTVLAQAALTSKATYSTLEQAVRNTAQIPNRKIVFFISDGFLLDPQNSDSIYRLRRITDAAARTNTVIYSFDPKGSEAGFPDGTTNSFRVQASERFEMQDALNALADETGGRFIKNTNDLQTGLNESLKEASQYYLLAWEPIDENSKSGKLRKIEVRVKNRPELKVRAQGGYLDEVSAAETSDANKAKDNRADKTPPNATEQQLNRAITAQIAVRQLPTSLVANYIDVADEGALLAAAMQIGGDAVEFAVQGEKATADVDIVGYIYNSQGKREAYFRQILSANLAASKLTETGRPNFYYNFQAKLKPGLYQVRVAARDAKSGRVGNAVQWLEIPDLSSKKLSLSSLILGGEETDAIKTQGKKSQSPEISSLPVSVDRRFSRASNLRYMIFVYNAARKNGKQPDVVIQTQVLRGRNVVLTSAMNPISTDGQDSLRLPYAAEIPLNAFLPGKYELQITVRDGASKTEATRRASFEIQ